MIRRTDPAALRALVETAARGRGLQFQPAQSIVERTARALGVSVAALTGPGRDALVANARHVAMFLMRATLEIGYSDIGRVFERDHSTVTTAIEKIAGNLRVGDYKTIELVRAVVLSDESTKVEGPRPSEFVVVEKSVLVTVDDDDDRPW